MLKFRERFNLARHALSGDVSRIRNAINFSGEIDRFFRGEDSFAVDGAYEQFSRDSLMSNPAQFAAVRVLNETIGSLPIMVYRKTDDGREVDTESNLYEIFHEVPNDEMTCQALKEAGMMSINMAGNAFFLKLKNRSGEIIGLKPIDYTKVIIERDKISKRITYKIENEKFTRDDIFHIPSFSYDGIVGLTPVTQCASTIMLGKQYQDYNKNFYKNAAFTSGVLEFPSILSEDSFNRLKKDFEGSYQGLVNAGKPIILEQGGQFKPLKMTQTDAQFMESRRFQIEEIARIYRVPLTLLQDFGRATWNNMEQQQLFFVMFTILPIVKRWEENIKTQIMTRKQRKSGLYVEFQLNSLLRGDIKTRFETYAIARQWGIMSINDILKLENMNPVENGDQRLQPLNMIPLDKVEEYYTNTISKSNTEPTNTTTDDEEIMDKLYKTLQKRGED